jgi:hypothetical protein
MQTTSALTALLATPDAQRASHRHQALKWIIFIGGRAPAGRCASIAASKAVPNWGGTAARTTVWRLDINLSARANT